MSSEQRETSLKKFNTTLTWLVNLLIRLNPRDDEIERLRGRMSIARGADRDFLIRECGPYLFKYQNHIITRNEQFFMDMQFSEMKDVEPSVRNLITKLREQYSKLCREEQDQIYGKVLDLLAAYVEYLDTCIVK